jgi:hypothetical protein
MSKIKFLKRDLYFSSGQSSEKSCVHLSTLHEKLYIPVYAATNDDSGVNDPQHYY